MPTIDAFLHDCSRGKERFCKLHPEPCLLFLLADESGGSIAPPMSFGTVAVDVELATRYPGYEFTREYRVVALKKAPENPWKDRMSLGRARNNDLVIRAPSISKLHAHCLVSESGGVSLMDLGSTNGTQLNGRNIAPNEGQKLKDGDRIRFGSVDTTLYWPPSLYRVLSEMLQGGNTAHPKRGPRLQTPE